MDSHDVINYFRNNHSGVTPTPGRVALGQDLTPSRSGTLALGVTLLPRARCVTLRELLTLYRFCLLEAVRRASGVCASTGRVASASVLVGRGLETRRGWHEGGLRTPDALPRP